MYVTSLRVAADAGTRLDGGRPPTLRPFARFRRLHNTHAVFQDEDSALLATRRSVPSSRDPSAQTPEAPIAQQSAPAGRAPASSDPAPL